jgi:hypothetical protein
VVPPVAELTADLDAVRLAAGQPEAAVALRRAAVDGRPVLRRVPALGRRLRTTLAATDRALRRDATTDALRLLAPTAEALEGTLDHVVPLQTACNVVGLFARNAADLIGEGDANGSWLRLALVLPLAQTVGRATSAEPDLHYRAYPDASCSVGNERWAPGRTLGDRPAATRQPVPATSAPAGTPKGPDGR